jgi:hypothetical protein
MKMDKVELVRLLEEANAKLLLILSDLMDSEPGTEEAEALNAVANAVLCLENYLYPEDFTWSDEDIYLDDEEDED